MSELGAPLTRRTLLAGSAALGLAATTSPAVAGTLRAAAPALVRQRITLPSGVQSGDVTTNGGVLCGPARPGPAGWSRRAAAAVRPPCGGPGRPTPPT